MKFNDPIIQRILARGRHKAIIKIFPGGRRMLCGFEPKSRRSRKYHIKLLTTAIDLDELGKDQQAQVEANARIEDPNAPPPPLREAKT